MTWLKEILDDPKKIASRWQRYQDSIRFFIRHQIIYILGFLLNVLDKKHAPAISVETLSKPLKNGECSIFCLGNIFERSGDDFFRVPKQLEKQLAKADLVFAADRSKNKTSRLAVRDELLRVGICNAHVSDTLFSCKIFETELGKIGVISYNRYEKAASRKHIKIELMRCYQCLKRQGAEYFVAFIHERMNAHKVNAKQGSLFRFLAYMGIDYSIGFASGYMDAGTNYLSRDGRIMQSIASLGSFYSGWGKPAVKLVLQLKLRRESGRLCVYSESYRPFCWAPGRFFSFLDPETCPAFLSKEQNADMLSKINHCMARLRRADQALTLRQLCDSIGAELPSRYADLGEHTVGKICARSIDVEPGDVFFFMPPFHDPNDKTPQTDAQRLRVARAASKKGAMFLFSYRRLPFSAPCLVVDDVREAHISVCRLLRERCHTRVIAITGSVGKTSTKDMLASVTETTYHTVKSNKNENVQVKMGLSLQKLDENTEIYIQELGGGRPGGASRHSRLIGPEIAVITNIGDAHIGNFNGDKLALMNNKLGVCHGLPDDGILLLNGDDPLLYSLSPNSKIHYSALTEKIHHKTLFYAVHNHEADFYADDIVEEGFSTSFSVVHGSDRTKLKLNVLGEYNVLNAVCCFAVGQLLQIPKKDIRRGLQNFRTSGIRQNLVNVSGYHLLMDCYNASSNSVAGSLELLSKLKGRHVAVLGDITGMGETSKAVHLGIGKAVEQNRPDLTILYGQELRIAQDYLQHEGICPIYVTTHRELEEALAQNAQPGDSILFKGSSKMLLEQAADIVFGSRFTDQRFLAARKYRSVTLKGVQYNLFNNYATAVRVKGSGVHPVVKKRVFGYRVVNAAAVFQNDLIESVQLPESLRHIGSFCFENCDRLIEIHLPSALLFIGREAFANCKALETLVLPDTLKHIGFKAFSGCTRLRSLYIPDSVLKIEKDAFANCPDLTVFCRKGSFAEEYLSANGVRYECRV